MALVATDSDAPVYDRMRLRLRHWTKTRSTDPLHGPLDVFLNDKPIKVTRVAFEWEAHDQLPRMTIGCLPGEIDFAGDGVLCVVKFEEDKPGEDDS